MSGWVCRAGGTLLIPSGRSGKHLHFILNDPCKFDGYAHEQCVLVSIGTIYKAPYDNTCVLDEDSHDFIKHPTYVVYSQARLDPADHIMQMVESNTWIPNNDASPELVEKIWQGLHKSKRTPRFIKQLKRA